MIYVRTLRTAHVKYVFRVCTELYVESDVKSGIHIKSSVKFVHLHLLSWQGYDQLPLLSHLFPDSDQPCCLCCTSPCALVDYSDLLVIYANYLKVTLFRTSDTLGVCCTIVHGSKYMADQICF